MNVDHPLSSMMNLNDTTKDAMMNTTMRTPDERTETQEYVDRMVAAGFETRDEIIQNAIGMAEDCDPELDKEDVAAIVDRSLAAHAELEKTWTTPTDNDRLEAAVTDLEGAGIVVRQNFTCCGTCGSTEIWDEMEVARNAGAKVRGYAFYHMQDAESAADGEGVYLSYGAVERTAGATAAIGEEICGKLRAHGLKVDWNGSLGERIMVTLEWRRRRTETTPAATATTIH